MGKRPTNGPFKSNKIKPNLGWVVNPKHEIQDKNKKLKLAGQKWKN